MYLHCVFTNKKFVLEDFPIALSDDKQMKKEGCSPVLYVGENDTRMKMEDSNDVEKQYRLRNKNRINNDNSEILYSSFI